MEDSEQAPSVEGESAGPTAEIKTEFKSFLEGDLRSITFHNAFERLKKADRELRASGIFNQAGRQQIIAELAENFETRMLDLQEEWLRNQPNDFDRKPFRSLAVATFLPWKAAAEYEESKQYKSKNPPPLEPGMLWRFNESLIQYGLVPMPEPAKPRVQQLKESLGNLLSRKGSPDKPS